ncbi:hypothetical protein SPHINGOT1_80276 [Sphingomonas sp. T1]|nr:hypothetical protein SPHINGOT1_80276 [Sphingomonas sp. T1]
MQRQTDKQHSLGKISKIWCGYGDVEECHGNHRPYVLIEESNARVSVTGVRCGRNRPARQASERPDACSPKQRADTEGPLRVANRHGQHS